MDMKKIVKRKIKEVILFIASRRIQDFTVIKYFNNSQIFF